MPNRNTFDDREKYDHSGHRTSGREPGDLAAAPNPAAAPNQKEQKEKARRTKSNSSSKNAAIQKLPQEH
jgi:hypothetical protein